MKVPVLVTVYAADIQRLAGFYAGVLGMVVEDSADGHVLLSGPGHELVIVRVPPEVVDQIGVLGVEHPREDTPIKMCFSVADIDSLRAVIGQLGGRLGPPDRVWSWRGHRHLDGVDPEGNVFQLRQAVDPFSR